MKPLDPRLLSYARGTTGLLVTSVGLGLASVVTIIAQAVLLGKILSAVIISGSSLAQVLPQVLWLALVVSLRAVLSGLGEDLAGRMAQGIIARMRRQLLVHISGFGLRRPAGFTSAGLAQVAGPGLDAVQHYLTGYLPQLVLAALVPLSMVAVLASQDLISASIVLLTLPLIPLFMALVGWYTNRQARNKLKSLQRLSFHFLDVVTGLPTLKVFGRAQSQAAAVGEVTEKYRRTTMKTLRVAFLSSLVLEVLATLSVALVAVTMGVRLVNGSIGLQVGLTVLILAPEAYFPLRALGTRFHAAADGVAAVEQAIQVLQSPVLCRSTTPVGSSEPSVSGTAGSVIAGRSSVELKGAGVRYEGRGGVAPVDLVLEHGRITALIGPSGVGKSTILAMIAGLVDPDEGQIIRGNDSLAMAGQHSFLVAGSIRQNLLLGNESCSDHRLERALRDAAAEFVFDLPAGWHTELTDDGAGLSSGQRQRLVLARTLARDAALVLLDEPTATLDISTESRVLQGLSRALRGRTVLLVTHRSAALAIADIVLELTPDGIRQAQMHEESWEQCDGGLPAELSEQAPADVSDLDERAPGVPAAGEKPAQPAGSPHVRSVPGALRRVLQLARPQWARLLGAAVLGALATGCAVALMGVSAWLISRAAQHPPILTLMVAVVGVRAFGIGRGVLRYAERLLSHDAALRVLAALRIAIVGRLAQIAPSGLPLWRRSDLLGRLVNDVDDIQDLLLRVLVPLVGAGVVCGVTVGAFVLILPAAGLALGLCLVVTAVLLPMWLVRRAGTTEVAATKIRAQRTSVITETVSHVVDLQLLGELPGRMQELEVLENQAKVVVNRRSRDAGITAGASFLGAGAASVLALLIGIPAVESGALNAVLLAVLALTPLALVEPIAGIGAAGAAFVTARTAADRVVQVLDAPDPYPAPARGTGAGDRGAAGSSAGGGDFEVAGRVEMRAVSARWPGAECDAITDVDLVIEPGDRVCVLGPSGSGKSTVLAVLLGFLPPTSGRLLVDGIDAATIDPAVWLRQFSWTGQESHVFATSIAENLRVADPAAERDAMAAALSQAGWQNWKDAAPGGLNTKVGEYGDALSGGERQRLLLARALLADRPILLADEPTAHLDARTAGALIESLLATGRTTVLVTHRESDALSCNKVVRMHDGRVASGYVQHELTQVR